ncbi:MAG TPA: hypothetical protein VHR45_18400 [Thermoanaerobaculia bacterium]|nr:hypothetical protein [Thermoanaerobaculia bacterium]
MNQQTFAVTAVRIAKARVYLSPPVLAILERLQPRTGRSEWVFESPKRPGQPLEFLGKVGGDICRAVGFSFTPHDLRRTGATHLGRLHFRDEDIDRILNHNRRGVRAVYNLYDGDVEKQGALVAWGAHVEAITSGQPGDRLQAV